MTSRLRLALALWTAAAMTLLTGTAAAELGFFLEYDYNLGETETRSPERDVTETKQHAFVQKYRLTWSRQIYPHLRLSSGGLFERVDSTTRNDIDVETHTTRVSPFLNLDMHSGPFRLGAGYHRREYGVRTSLSGRRPTLINETYNANLQWSPLDLPRFGLTYTRTRHYDEDRLLRNLRTDSLQLSSHYSPVRQLDLGYSGSLVKSEDFLTERETETLHHSGRIEYSERFYDQRVQVNSGYRISYQNSTSRFQRDGSVSRAVSGTGLFALSDVPEAVELDSVGALSDGQWEIPSPVVLAFSPLSEDQDTARRNLGIHVPAGLQTEINGLFIGVAPAPGRDLPALESTSLTWEVYVSEDNFNWRLHQVVPSTPFEINPPFSVPGVGYEVRFAGVNLLQTPYIKVVTTPLLLPPGAPQDSPEVFVSEIQGFLTEFADGREIESSTTVHSFNTSARARVLEDPNLYYEFDFNYFERDPGSFSIWSLRNGLTATKRLRPWLTAHGRISRQDGGNSLGEHQWDISYSASVSAAPLPVLYHTLGFSGRRDEDAWFNAFSLTNRVGIYRGIDLLLTGSASFTDRDDGRNSRTYQGTFGAAIRPHRTMVWNVHVSHSESKQSGGGAPDTSSSIFRASAGVTYAPLPSLSLSYNGHYLSMDGEERTFHSWGGNWSPLRGGAVQLFFTYSENVQPEIDASSRVLSSGARWRIRRGTFLDLTVSRIEGESAGTETRSDMIFSSLKILL